MPNSIQIKRALISVSDKTNIVEFAQCLHSLNIEIISTGGTANLLRKNDIPVIEVDELTEFPEMMGGRVKTLHPKLHGGILAREVIDDEVLVAHQIPRIDLVVVNLYPFEKITNQPDVSLEEAIENIDIGGPTLLRSAAKNYQRVTVVVSIEDYPKLMVELKANQGTTQLNTRFALAKKIFAHTARYDGIIANYLTSRSLQGDISKFPDVYTMQYIKNQDLRYGENPHQHAAWYQALPNNISQFTASQQAQGKPLSYNNLVDADCAFECVQQFGGESACVIVKHANPCGVSIAATQPEAYQKAYLADSLSAFGGVIAFNTILEAKTVQLMLDTQFVEVLIAPAITQEALMLLTAKPQVRVLINQHNLDQNDNYEFKKLNQGLLIQEKDSYNVLANQLEVVTQRHPSVEEMTDLLFAWKVCKFVKSNAIVYAKNNQTVGIGAGQMSRVFSSKIAGMKAQDAKFELRQSVMASDAFFPFRDGIDEASKLGVTAIIQPGGSIRDQEIIQAADEAQIAMVFTRIRHFRH